MQQLAAAEDAHPSSGDESVGLRLPSSPVCRSPRLLICSHIWAEVFFTPAVHQSPSLSSIPLLTAQQRLHLTYKTGPFRSRCRRSPSHPGLLSGADEVRFDHLSVLRLLPRDVMRCHFIHLFLGAETLPLPESRRQNQRGEKNQLQPLRLPRKQAVSESVCEGVGGWGGGKRRTKEASGPSNFQTSGGQGGERPVRRADMQTPAQNRPLSHLKMAPSAFKHNQASISD